jgi:hypothetical protein
VSAPVLIDSIGKDRGEILIAAIEESIEIGTDPCVSPHSWTGKGSAPFGSEVAFHKRAGTLFNGTGLQSPSGLPSL